VPVNYRAIFISDKRAEPLLSHTSSTARPFPGEILSPERDAIITFPFSLLQLAKKPSERLVVRISVIVTPL
jgi:hypothetical protein